VRRIVIIRRLGKPGDLGWVVMAHGEVYAAEYGWDTSFESLVARIVADFDPDRDAAWIAESNGERVGCVFCVRVDEKTAKLRILLVHPAARGHGAGARLVDECVAHARDSGYRRLTLWTNDVLAAARHIYESAGFHLTDEYSHRSYGKNLVGQNWLLELK
jgi:N-acetylglutamate synthase-like GNAT family acetyltransferase